MLVTSPLGRAVLGRRAGGGLDPDAAAYIAAMSVAPDVTRRTLINDLIVGLKADGVWSLLDVLYLLAAHDAQAARLNLRAPGSNTATTVGTVTFTTDRGYRGNGSNGYLDTNFNLTTPGALWTRDNASMFSWLTAAASTSSTDVSPIWGSGSNSLREDRRTTATGSALEFYINSPTTPAGFGGETGSNRLGSRGAVRLPALGTNVVRGYRNGTAAGANTSSGSGAVSNENAWLLRSSGDLNGNDTVGAAALGAGLTDAQMLALHTRIGAYLTAIGAA